MAGLIPPSSGSVVLQGKPVMGPREDIGMMFQQATLFTWRTVMENVVLPIEIRDGKKAARAAPGRARELLSMAGTDERRVGKEWFRTVNYRWAPVYYKTK